MSGLLEDFYPGTTVEFSVTCSLDGVPQNITGDTVYVTIKDVRTKTDADALIKVNADVATEGAAGKALFELTPTITNVRTGRWYMDVTWVRSGGDEHVIHSQRIGILKRVSDA